MVNLELIRVLTASDIANISETESDTLACVDRDTTVAAATFRFPYNPRNGQLIGLSTRVQVTALSIDTGPSGRPVVGYSGPFTLNTNTVFWRIYLEGGDKWFPY